MSAGRLRRVGAGGQLRAPRVGVLRGARGRRGGIDVERRPADGLASPANRIAGPGVTPRRFGYKTHGGDGRDHEEGGA